jgi:phage I-like protein
MNTVTLYFTLPTAAGHAGAIDASVEWLHLVPAGTFRAADGRGPWKLTDAAAVIAASMANGALTLDVNHATDHAMKTGGDAPAHGWIVELQSRADGIWGRVDWNASGKQLLANRSYRGVSPVINVDKTGRVTQILRAALTNTPALTSLTTLLSKQDQTVDVTQLRAALKLPETADETTILATITQHAEQRGAVETLVQRAATAAGVTAATPDALVLALAAQKATTVPNETVVQLQAQIDTMRTQRLTETATSFIDTAIKAGKPIVASREALIAMHAKDPAGIEKLVNAMPSINAGGTAVTKIALAESDDGDALDETEMATCKKMSLDPKEFAKTKKAQRKAKEAA